MGNKRKTACQRDKVRKTYMGLDGRQYRGKAIKKRKSLDIRIKEHNEFISKCKGSAAAYTMPGSMSGKK